VNEHNRKNLGYKLELNKFADYTDEEFRMMTGLIPADPEVEGSIPFPHNLEELSLIEQELPEIFDMRLDGNMRPVKSEFNKILHSIVNIPYLRRSRAIIQKKTLEYLISPLTSPLLGLAHGLHINKEKGP
jgi:hypothetical protein